MTGVIAIETSVSGVTVSMVLPVTPHSIAVIVVEPGITDVARPLEPVTLLMVATPVLDELQITSAVSS